MQQYTQARDDIFDRQLTDDSYEPEYPYTSTLPHDPLKLDKSNTMNSNEPEEDAVSANDSDADVRYSDTTPINVLFRDFPAILTSASTILDQEPNIHDIPEKPYSARPSTNNIGNSSDNLRTDSFNPGLYTNIQEEVTPEMDFIKQYENEETKILEYITRNDIL